MQNVTDIVVDSNNTNNTNSVLPIVSDKVAEKVFDVLTETNLNWSVRKENLVSASGLPTNSVGIFRSDNNSWLGTVTSKYTPYQNSELVTTIVEAAEYIGIEVASGGCIKGGQKVFLQLQLPDAFIGKSAVKRYITALNSHNGKSSVAFGSTNTVVVCQNTFYKAYRELPKFRHNTNAFERIRLTAMEMKNSIKEDVKLMETFQLMSSLGIKDDALEAVMKNTFNIDLNQSQDKMHGKKFNKIQKVAQAIEIEKNLEGNTLWGLFNGITRYTNHMITYKGTAADNIMQGQGYNYNLKAFNTIVEWIEKNTTETVPVNI
jgi:phage/plasmid-like protein (TIGR03299 family)